MRICDFFATGHTKDACFLFGKKKNRPCVWSIEALGLLEVGEVESVRDPSGVHTHENLIPFIQRIVEAEGHELPDLLPLELQTHGPGRPACHVRRVLIESVIFEVSRVEALGSDRRDDLPFRTLVFQPLVNEAEGKSAPEKSQSHSHHTPPDGSTQNEDNEILEPCQ